MRKAKPRERGIHFRLPDNLYDELQGRIEASGISLTDYMKQVLFDKHDQEEMHNKEPTDGSLTPCAAHRSASATW